jgi:hypothetical protein
MHRTLTATLAAVALLLAACGGGETAPADGVETPADGGAAGGYDVADQPEAAAAVFVTPTDGDTIFALSNGHGEVSHTELVQLTGAAQLAAARAIVNSIL